MGTRVSTWMQVCCMNMMWCKWCMEPHMYVEHMPVNVCACAGVRGRPLYVLHVDRA